MLGFNPCKSLLLYGTHGIRNAVLPLRFNPVPMNFDCCGGWIRTNVDRLMRPGWDLLQSTPQCFSLLIYKNYAKLTNFCKKITILLIIRRLHDSELVEISQRPPFVPVHKEPPLYPRTTFKHKCPGSTLRNLEIVLVLGPGKPY